MDPSSNVTLRPYQREAVDSVRNHLMAKATNPCVVLPTGTGKSVVIAEIANLAVNRGGSRVLVLAHVKELLEQNASKIRALCPSLSVGVYSAGLDCRDTRNPVIVAGINSVYRRPDVLGRFDLVLIDECHMIPPDGDGMYRTFLDGQRALNPDVRLVGFTATPYRLKGGVICKPENLLNEICYEAGLKDMIRQGYLSPLISKESMLRADLGDLHIRGGEFVQEDIDAAMDNDKVVDSACREIVSLTRERRTVLIFCTSVAHCQHVARRIAAISGTECAVVTGETPAHERAETIARMRGSRGTPNLLGESAPPLKFCANVAVMTTGLDIPNIDCVALLRPTMSPGLLLQMCGRGLRLAEGKKDCMVLDFAGNIMRHGPLDMIRAPDEGTKDMGPPPMKTCPQCREILLAGLRACPCCGHVFSREEGDALPHDGTASTMAVLSGEVRVEEFDVQRLFISEHRKRGWRKGDPVTVRIDYMVGLMSTYSEWICPEHTGYAREKFEKWWRTHTVPSDDPPPDTADDAAWLLREGMMKPVAKIKVRTVAGKSFPEITCVFGEARDSAQEPEPPPADDSDDFDVFNDLPF